MDNRRWLNRAREASIFVFVGLILLAGVLAPAAPTQAQSPIERVLAQVLEHLEQELGRDFTLVEYSYALRTWTDASLGCAEPGRSYAEGEVQGYIWQISISNDETYELRSTTDGSMVVLCTPVDRAVSINYRVYQTDRYLVDYPETWQTSSNEDASVAVFSANGTESCSQPGMKIRYLAGVGNNNAVLDNTIREAGLVQAVGVRTPVGLNDSGLTILYQGACDGTLLQYRVTAYPASTPGDGFLIQQWATPAEYETWSSIYLAIVNSFRLVGEGGIAEGAPVEVEPERALAGYPLAHVFVQDVYVGTFSDLPGYGLSIGNKPERRSLRFSADGQYLAYIDEDTAGQERLSVAMGTGRPATVATGLVNLYPPTWAPQENVLAFLKVPESAEEEGPLVQSVTPGSQEAETLGTLPVPTDCSLPETPYITEQLYMAETGPDGNPVIFEWLPDNRFLFTMTCEGTGLAIWHPDNDEIETVGEDLHRVSVSVDRSKVAALDSEGALVVIDLASGEQQNPRASDEIDQLTWSWNGERLYYSVVRNSETMTLDDPAQESDVQRYLGVFPYVSELNELVLVELDLAGEVLSRLWVGRGYAIGRIVPTPNNNGLVFSLIPSDRNLLQVLATDEVDYMSLRLFRPETRLQWLPPEGGEPQLIVVSSQPVFAPRIPPQSQTSGQ